MVNLDLIKRFEGCRLKAYQDSVGVWTVGWGHTGTVNGVDIHAGMVITQKEADLLLQGDVDLFAFQVHNMISHPASQHQFDALVSFAYNLGSETLRQSTLLKKFNAGDIVGAAEQFAEFVHAGGTILMGLVRRRAAEIVRFLS